MKRHFAIIAAALFGAMALAGEPPASIGTATMDADGTIHLQLRATSDSGAVGDGFFTYKPDNPQYAEIKKHIGDIKPGQSKPVPPWPDKK